MPNKKMLCLLWLTVNYQETNKISATGLSMMLSVCKNTLLPCNTDLLKNPFPCWWRLKEGLQVTCPREPSSGQALYLSASNSAWLLLHIAYFLIAIIDCIFLSSHKGRALKKMVLHCYVNVISASQDDWEEGKLITALAFSLTEHMLPETPN